MVAKVALNVTLNLTAKVAANNNNVRPLWGSGVICSSYSVGFCVCSFGHVAHLGDCYIITGNVRRHTTQTGLSHYNSQT